MHPMKIHDRVASCMHVKQVILQLCAELLQGFMLSNIHVAHSNTKNVAHSNRKNASLSNIDL